MSDTYLELGKINTYLLLYLLLLTQFYWMREHFFNFSLGNLAIYPARLNIKINLCGRPYWLAAN